MMRLNVLLFIVLSGAAVTLSGAARGAPPPAKSDVATDKARELHVEGDELYKQGQYARARVSFLAAWSLKKHWQLAGSLGDCEIKLGMYRDAAEHLAYFLRASPKQPPPPDAQKLYAQARAKTGALRISADTEGADVLVDGQVVGKAPLADPVFVEPGHHSVEARLGATRATEEKDVALGGEQEVALKLVAPMASPPPPLGGSVAQPTTQPKRSILPGVISGGAGVVVAGVGVGLLVAGGGKGSDADTLLAGVRAREKTTFVCPKAPECAAIKGLRVAHDTDVNIGLPMLAVGGAAVVAGVVYLLWPKSAAATQRGNVTVVPILGASGGGLTLSRTF